MNILLVDDDPQFQRAIKRNVEVVGYDMHCVSDVREALIAFDNGYFDLVITDLKMPMVDGQYLVELLRVRNKKIPIIVLSGNVGELEKELYQYGATKVLEKPIAIEKLIAVMQELGKDSK